jgi:hypothetical protein
VFWQKVKKIFLATGHEKGVIFAFYSKSVKSVGLCSKSFILTKLCIVLTGASESSLQEGSVVDPDRVGTAAFCRIRIGINSRHIKNLINYTFISQIFLCCPKRLKLRSL